MLTSFPLARGGLFPEDFAVVADHVVNGNIALPGALYVSLALASDLVPQGYLSLSSYLSVCFLSFPAVNSVCDVDFLRFCEWLDFSAPLPLHLVSDGKTFSFVSSRTEYAKGNLAIHSLPAPLEVLGR